MKGVLLCGGKGTRLRPGTLLINKHLFPILTKPMVLYPLETLKSLGVTDILIVTGGDHVGDFAEFLGDGSEYDVNLTYRVQKEAGGIAQALGLAKDFAAGGPVVVILGDNIFDVDDWNMRLGLNQLLRGVATLVVKKVRGAQRFGVLVGEGFRKGDKNRFHIIEKPKDIETGNVVTGLYFYPNSVFDVITKLKPSERGEIEISDVNNHFLEHGMIRICYLQDQDFWSDAGTPESLFEAIKWAHRKNT